VCSLCLHEFWRCQDVATKYSFDHAAFNAVWRPEVMKKCFDSRYLLPIWRQTCKHETKVGILCIEIFSVEIQKLPDVYICSVLLSFVNLLMLASLCIVLYCMLYVFWKYTFRDSNFQYLCRIFILSPTRVTSIIVTCRTNCGSVSSRVLSQPLVQQQ
jgi:hypothetical protein